MGGTTCDREELAWATRGKSCGLGDGQYNHINYHGLAPCFLKAPMDRGFNLSIPFPRPLINAQIHPNSQKRAKAC